MSKPDAPQIRNLGIGGALVTFSDTLTEAGNRAALAFRAAVQAENWEGVEETSTSLTSAFVGFDARQTDFAAVSAQITALLETQDWLAAPFPEGRRHWRIPVVLGTDLAPQFEEACAAMGLTPAEARADLAATTTRVLTIGFAPGQPYLGTMPPAWNLPRQSGLSPLIPQSALVAAIRQFCLFTADTPTGWRHFGQTAFKCFRPNSDQPFALRPGDEVSFAEVTPEELRNIRAADTTGDGGATVRPV